MCVNVAICKQVLGRQATVVVPAALVLDAHLIRIKHVCIDVGEAPLARLLRWLLLHWLPNHHLLGVSD